MSRNPPAELDYVRAERIVRDDKAIHLRLGGVVDDASHQDLTSGLIEKDEFGRPVLISLRDVILLNSSGIGMLLKLNRALREQGGKLILVDVPASVRQVLQFMKLEEILRIADDEQTAEEMLR